MNDWLGQVTSLCPSSSLFYKQLFYVCVDFKLLKIGDAFMKQHYLHKE